MARLFVYRTQPSDGARALAEALNGTRWRDKVAPLVNKARPGDTVICWGEAFEKAGVRVLNGVGLSNKFRDAEKLRAAGIPTIEVSRTRPPDQEIPAGPDPAVPEWERVAELAEDFANIEIGTTIPRNRVALDGVGALRTAIDSLLARLNQPAPVATRRAAGNWIGRDANHVGGADLLNPVATPDYWVKKEEGIVREFRVHSFKGKSIRAGIKDVRDDADWQRLGRQPHDWVRSWDGGWRIKYDGISSKQRHRDLAAQAITALGLDFGAVDIGERADKSLIVFEVNRAPGLAEGTIDKYVEAIQGWLNGGN